MMFNQRTNCVYRKMKEMLDAGELGELKRVNWIVTDWYRTQFYYDSGAWRATWAGEGGGVLLKYNARQTYTTSGFTGAAFAEICKKAGVPVQVGARAFFLP